MRSILLGCLVMAVALAVHAQLPAGVEDRPTGPTPIDYMCEAPEDGECGYDALLCSAVGYSGNGPLPTGCRPGFARSTGPQRAATVDDANICNCPVGHYVQQLIGQPEPVGSCVPYTKLGAQCIVDLHCVERYGRYVSSPSTENDNPVGELFCRNSVCVECDTVEWNRLSRFPNIGEPYTCPGIDGPASESYGFVIFGSSHPGETRTCSSGGVLTSGGTLDYNYVSVPFVQQQTGATTGSGDATSGANRIAVVFVVVALAVLLSA